MHTKRDHVYVRLLMKRSGSTVARKLLVCRRDRRVMAPTSAMLCLNNVVHPELPLLPLKYSRAGLACVSATTTSPLHLHRLPSLLLTVRPHPRPRSPLEANHRTTVQVRICHIQCTRRLLEFLCQRGQDGIIPHPICATQARVTLTSASGAKRAGPAGYRGVKDAVFLVLVHPADVLRLTYADTVLHLHNAFGGDPYDHVAHIARNVRRYSSCCSVKWNDRRLAGRIPDTNADS